MHVNFEAYLEASDLQKQDPSSKQKSPERSVRLKVNVYGPLLHSDAVGSTLSSCELFLQEPYWLPGGIDYSNPHVISFEGITEWDVMLYEATIQEALGSRATQNIDWSAVLDDLPQHHGQLIKVQQTLLISPLLK